MARTRDDARDAQRREAILEAAKACFVQFGYAKTSLDDIATRAGISRPLIYRKFKNKEDILSALLEFMFEGRYPRAEQALESPGSPREKLLQVYEVLLLEPWDELMGAPMPSEIFEACARLYPEVEAEHERRLRKYTQAVLESRELSEVFMLAVDGLQLDFPSTRVLRKRLQVLAERFVP
jgi:AcrR family transcriptional regulator